MLPSRPSGPRPCKGEALGMREARRSKDVGPMREDGNLGPALLLSPVPPPPPADEGKPPPPAVALLWIIRTAAVMEPARDACRE